MISYPGIIYLRSHGLFFWGGIWESVINYKRRRVQIALPFGIIVFPLMMLFNLLLTIRTMIHSELRIPYNITESLKFFSYRSLLWFGSQQMPQSNRRIFFKFRIIFVRWKQHLTKWTLLEYYVKKADVGGICYVAQIFVFLLLLFSFSFLLSYQMVI